MFEDGASYIIYKMYILDFEMDLSLPMYQMYDLERNE